MNKPIAPGAARRCPICRKPAEDEKFRPFCSKRCHNVDLHRWLAGVYAVPAVENDDDDETPRQEGEPR
jgi:uncharacterized protein